MSFETVIKRLQNGPAVLFIGQKYLSLESGSDHILKKIKSKYNSDISLADSNYDLLLKIGISTQGPEFFQWMQGLCKSISLPAWLEEIGNFPWSAVYTTAYDTIIERAFISPHRLVQPVVNDKFQVNDPRNRTKLHMSYLLGYIAAADPFDRPSLTLLDKTKRRTVFNALLHRLPSLVTPRGILVIDGYDIDDQLPVDDLYAQLYQLGHHQILLHISMKLVNPFRAKLYANLTAGRSSKMFLSL